MDRRKLLVGGAISLCIGKTTELAAQSASVDDIKILSEVPELPSDLKDKASSGPASYTGEIPVGTGRPNDNEIRKAFELLINSPYDTSPIEVAQYFLAVGGGAYGSEYKQYIREWPVRANPLIFHFFSSTATQPAGDTTAWCAAFVNWCLLRAHARTRDEIGKTPSSFSQDGLPFPSENIKIFSTNSASSGSFRCWREKSVPKRGDIVVFKNVGTDGMTRACLGTGHVAFFMSVPSDGWVQVLGGNQSSPGSNGAVTIANMRTSSGSRFMKYVELKSA